MERQKKVAIFNDLSGFGRCSISVMLPILSVMGHQGVAIPTAILSMHTEFPHYHMVDFTDELPAYLKSFDTRSRVFRCGLHRFSGKRAAGGHPAALVVGHERRSDDHRGSGHGRSWEMLSDDRCGHR